MEWLWEIYRPYVRKQLPVQREAVDEKREHQRFLEILRESTVTVLVQVPWQNSIRFKGLARYAIPEATELLNNPADYLGAHFGGGKYKLNFHHGWNFVGTRNFKAEGPPRWEELPEIEF